MSSRGRFWRACPQERVEVEGGVYRPGLGGSGNGFYKCANVCSFPSASLSPTAVLYMLLSVNRCACGSASVRWLVTSHFPFDPFPTTINLLPLLWMRPCQRPS